MRSSLLLVIVIMVGLFPLVAIAAVPPLLNYQGMLRDTAGDPAPDGNYSVTFRIWDSEISGAALWQEGRLVTVQDGLFTVLLGSIVPIQDTLFSDSNRWIGLQVGLDPEMSPRQRLVSVPFAWYSLESDRSDTASVARTVDTSGYSAYADLLSEGRIGDQLGQIAAGDHIHSLGQLRIVEDATTFDTLVSGPGITGQEIGICDLHVPAGEVGHSVHVRAGVYNSKWFSNGPTRWLIRINGVVVVQLEGTFGQTTMVVEGVVMRTANLGGTEWITPGLGYRTIDDTNGLDITVSVVLLMDGAYEFHGYLMQAIYDGH